MPVEFNIKLYDVGGKNATKGDNKLTGEEINIARKAGWDIDKKNGYTLDMDTPKRIETNEPESCDVIGDLIVFIFDLFCNCSKVEN